jgi:hypothetical protein
MYFLNFFTIIAPLILTIYLINKYCNKYKKEYKKFDYKNIYDFHLKKIEIIKNNKIIDNIIYEKHLNKYILLDNSIIINITDFDFICINYTLNSKMYKYITNYNNFKINLYNNEDIIDYVYINKIHDCLLKINYTTINIQNEIIYFLGPNYNFYNDNNAKLNYINVIKYILIKRNIYFSNEEILDSKINFKDNFMNEYNINNNTFNGDLNWKPTL